MVSLYSRSSWVMLRELLLLMISIVWMLLHSVQAISLWSVHLSAICWEILKVSVSGRVTLACASPCKLLSAIAHMVPVVGAGGTPVEYPEPRLQAGDNSKSAPPSRVKSAPCRQTRPRRVVSVGW